ncbi:MAG: MBL fold metallo-hydrolase [Anaerolineales bacterium]|nr:MBL fold metallo-hydrolase [Anaerolineales bacterium]
MAQTRIVTLDLNFQGRPHAIASYLIRDSDSVVLIESGPGSTLSSLTAGLAAEGLTPRDVTHVLLTHIHLDHAGAAGWLANQGAEIYVHPVGAPHMLNPEKLIASATRIYGDRMQTLWGEFLPVPENKLHVAIDGEAINIGGAEFIPHNTPGHAEHHLAYQFEDLIFCGDVGGVRIPGYQYLRVPMPPPELNIERWKESLAKLRALNPALLAPTHFGIYENDANWQFDEIEKGLDSAVRWLEKTMTHEPPIEDLRESFTNWVLDEGKSIGLSDEVLRVYELANPLGMSADGLLRYWKKVRGGK